MTLLTVYERDTFTSLSFKTGTAAVPFPPHTSPFGPYIVPAGLQEYPMGCRVIKVGVGCSQSNWTSLLPKHSMELRVSFVFVSGVNVSYWSSNQIIKKSGKVLLRSPKVTKKIID